jgi:hypothetical protein
MLIGCEKKENLNYQDKQTKTENDTKNEFVGVWHEGQKENAGKFLYVVGDGTAYTGETDDKIDNLKEIVYESKDIYTCEIDGEKLTITNSEYGVTHTFEKNGNELIDEEGEKWSYIQESVSIVRDE